MKKKENITGFLSLFSLGIVIVLLLIELFPATSMELLKTIAFIAAFLGLIVGLKDIKNKDAIPGLVLNFLIVMAFIFIFVFF